MRGILEFHNRNLQQHGHINEAWEEAFRNDKELRGTRKALSRVVHNLPKAAQLRASVKVDTASQDDYYHKPVHDLFDVTELSDLSLGASDVKEDFSLLEELASHVDEVHIDNSSGDAEDGVPADMPAAEAYGVLGEEEAYVSGQHGENALHSTASLRGQLKAQSVGAGSGRRPPPPVPSPSFDRNSGHRRRQQTQVTPDSATEGPSFRRFEVPPPLTEDDDFKPGSTWLEDTHSVWAMNGRRQENHFAAPRQRVYEEQPWPEPLPASAFVKKPGDVPVESSKIPKKQGSDEEREVIRTLRKRLSSFLNGTEA